ncbi:hypothetical protein AB0J86_14410 [Micromonospora sp. NPDC049559]|uniref:hypothetical protein n=1 Tax=Micromonospora sp. NPDC049559 TaxID=3155923 RepID=UPI00343EDEDF
MTQHPTDPPRAAGTGPATEYPTPAARPRTGGFGLLPFVVEKPAALPASDASWAFSLRRFARGAVWLLPTYGALLALVTLFGPDVGVRPFAPRANPILLFGWMLAVWLGLMALLALAGLLITSRSRGIAAAGLLVTLGGTVLMLPFVGLPQWDAVYHVDARVLALIGGTVYSAGWLLAGWAVIRSGVFSYADGGLLMASAPLLGVGGLLVGALQTYGGMLALAGGIGVAWRTGRLVPEAGEATALHSAPGTVAARAAAADGGGSIAAP